MIWRGTAVAGFVLLASCGATEPSSTASDSALREIVSEVPAGVLADPALGAVLEGDAEALARALHSGTGRLSPGFLLETAVSSNACRTDVLRVLVDAGADPSRVDPGTLASPLLRAAGSGARECFEFLLAAGADASAVDVNGYGVIANAYMSGDSGFFEWILGHAGIANHHPRDLVRAVHVSVIRKDAPGCRALVGVGVDAALLEEELGPGSAGPVASEDPCRF